jgi:peptide/nickel transport system ATP-binding protein
LSLEPHITDAVLSVRDLSVSFATRQGVVQAVDGLSFDVGAKEVLGIVGESGSGKSVAMYSMLGLVRDANVTITGSVLFEGREILGLSDTEMQSVRGGEVGMIFQDPMTALTPVYTVGWQIVEQLRAHNDMTKKQAYERATELLAEVGIPDPKSRINHFPHEFSGGMRQRVVIAMALSCNPKLLIADEPTTALDVTTQAQILKLMRDLVDDRGLALLMITHNLGVVREAADTVYVMYAGSVVEHAPTAELFARPRHPYTRALIDCVPKLSGEATFRGIDGSLPDYAAPPPGCRFAPRCPLAIPACGRPPEDRSVGAGHHAACWRLEEAA